MTFPILGGNSAVGGYTIDNSLRFNDGDSPYLSRSFTSVTNTKKFTASFWFKPSQIPQSNYSGFLDVGGDNAFSLVSDSTIYFFEAGGNQFYWRPKMLFRDCSAWYHFVLACDSTLATQTDRVKMYVNGVRITDFHNNSGPSQNYDFALNTTSNTRYIGTKLTTSSYYDGYLAEFYQIDGQQLEPTNFGEFDDSGIWKPIEYTGTFGNAGYYLDFENSGSLGADQSGNGNNFTPTNFTATDQTQDTPTNNFCTLNPLAKAGIAGFPYDGNLSHAGQTSGYEQTVLGTIIIPAGTGKWYWESKMTGKTTSGIGVVATDVTDGTDYTGTYTFSSTAEAPFSYNYGWGVIGTTGNIKHDGAQSSYSTGDLNQVRQCAIDCENGKIYFGVNNVWGNSGDPAAGTNPAYTDTDLSTKNIIPWSAVSDTDGRYRHMNFGNPNAGFNETTNESDQNGYGKFKYAPPSGFLALCTQNLATELSPTIDDGSQYFDTTLHTGNNGSGRTFTGLNFQPDWIWGKVRDSSNYTPFSVDSSRGGDKFLTISSTAAEDPGSHGEVSSFNSDGTTWIDGSNGTYPRLYYNDGSGSTLGGSTYVFWQWKANGGSTSSNTDGTIASTVQANPTAGFSIVTYTGTQANATVGHGLGVAPKFIITKCRSATNGWPVYHYSLSATDFIRLNQNTGTATNSIVWNNTEPTSTVFSIGANDENNKSGADQLAYCFAEIEGYSKFGSYTANANTDGPFIYTGFKPAFIIAKNTTIAQQWVMIDNTRDTFNEVTKGLNPDKTNAEADDSLNNGCDFLSNGFKIRAISTGDLNYGSGHNYIYMAFAESPFVTSTGVPVTAR